MRTIIRRSGPAVLGVQHEVVHTYDWRVRSSSWSPPTDVYETEQAIVVRVEIAGMREEDFEVALENGMLLIAGSRPDKPERRAYHQMEIRFGRFLTAVGLSAAVDVDASRAEYADGFLTVTLPKEGPRVIEAR
jgi:HSP20 family protein